LSYKIAFKKSVSRDLKKLSKDDVERILDKIEQTLPEKANTFPLLTGKFAGLRKFSLESGTIESFTLLLKTRLLF